MPDENISTEQSEQPAQPASEVVEPVGAPPFFLGFIVTF